MSSTTLLYRAGEPGYYVVNRDTNLPAGGPFASELLAWNLKHTIDGRWVGLPGADILVVVHLKDDER